MSSRTTDDSHALPPEETPLRAEGAPDVGAVQPKAKTKRPRPTFEDGSLTRVFKFPSKAYPKSSYYVTDTEIIIRIRKARKKWQLVLPKKRVVAYRTNRWFAKPRWIELELTYTQAARHGLAAPRSQPNPLSLSAALPAATHRIVEDNGVLASQAALEHASPLVAESATHPQADRSEQFMPADDYDPEADFGHLEDDTGVAELRPVIGPEIHPIQTGSRARRPALALGLVVFLAAWITQIDFSILSRMNGDACARSEPPASCAPSIVTGSIAKIEAVPEPAAPVAPTPLAPEPAANAAANVETQSAAVEGPILDVAAPTQNLEALPPVSSIDCRELSAFGRAINIQFDYASSILKRSVFTSLDAFALKLRSCPSAKVIIEGHTDSDGRANRNRTLSVRRARVVQDHIVKAGAPPEQLATIGFGQTRPYVPNVSTMNKRSNRRAVLVVELAGP